MLKLRLSFLLLLLSSLTLAQDPIIQPEGLVELGEHTWVIPDNELGSVPNVDIVISHNATLVIDPGLCRENGEIVLQEARKLSDTSQCYIVSPHYHPEHTIGYLAFPESAVYINSMTQGNEFVRAWFSIDDRALASCQDFIPA